MDSRDTKKARPNREDTVDPRIERSREAVLRAALDELGETGFGAFTIESIAVRCGVARSTIYRHWPNKQALIAAAFETFHQRQAPDIVSGSPRERLESIIRHVAGIVGDSIFSACIPALIDGAERDGGLREFHHRFQAEARAPLIALIADGVGSGDFPAYVDPEMAALALLGILFYRRLMTSETFDANRSKELINTMFGPPAKSESTARKRHRFPGSKHP
jgi:TetR/AcrR family transcriptional regulator, regulator of autoinduction and epiphytic fitness